MTGYILPNANNRIRSYKRPHRTLPYFTLDAGINRPILVRARQVHDATAATRTHHYYLHGYNGILRYSFEFIIDQTHDNKIRAPVIRGCLNLCIQVTSTAQPLPTSASRRHP